MTPLGIERLCVFGMPPVEFVGLAAELDCRFIGVALTPMRYYNPHNYPDWSLRDDASLRREMRAAMQDRDVSISLCEGFGVGRDIDVGAYAADLDLVRELGGGRVNVVSMDKDFARSADGFAAFAELAAARGIEVVTEIGPGPIRNLAAAQALVDHVGRENFRLLIDTMHLFRLGGAVAEVAALDPKLIGYVQLCDAPLQPAFPTYMEEALHERLPPGDGELPLGDFLKLVPHDVVVSVEVPRRSLAEADLNPHDQVAPVVAAARRMLADAR
ncbi:TIM barrel protein [Phenylobacterium sp. LjRoot219]|uniref:sugar phosphate isomerase/epimerase family protein n=1 Tax=Phenylobacterium sp. LjRoot219 TaxID=3342283 RepID=UPI003ECF484B